MAIAKDTFIDQWISITDTQVSEMQAAKAALAPDIDPRDTRIDKITHLQEMIDDTTDARLRGKFIEQLEKWEKMEVDSEAAIANYDLQIGLLQAQSAELTRLKTA